MMTSERKPPETEQASERRRAGQRGFTMVEVMVAVLLTAIAVLGIIALYITETRASSYSRHATEASILASDKLEKLRTETLVDGTYTETAIGPQADDPNLPTGSFDRTWVISNAANLGVTYIDLAVTVSWDEDGTAREVVIYGKRNK